jgi:hypothetical protein
MTRKEDCIVQVQGIISEYTGMRLTLRQIYYRLVAAQFFANAIASYKWLSTVLVDARKDGAISYGSIEDRTRAMHAGYGESWTAAGHFRRFWEYISDMDNRYSMPKWWGQPCYIQVWLEKQALSALFEQITDTEGVDLAVCRGYPSWTFLKEAADLLEAVDGKKISIVYFGDFDPSGADIERFVSETLTEFGLEIDFHRVAITREQIDLYNIPPAPAKQSDSRTAGFLATEGVAWQVELDAIEPRTLQGLVQESIREVWDEAQGRRRVGILGRRRAAIRGWLEEAINPDFNLDDIEDEDDEA